MKTTYVITRCKNIHRHVLSHSVSVSYICINSIQWGISSRIMLPCQWMSLASEPYWFSLTFNNVRNATTLWVTQTKMRKRPMTCSLNINWYKNTRVFLVKPTRKSAHFRFSSPLLKTRDVRFLDRQSHLLIWKLLCSEFDYLNTVTAAGRRRNNEEKRLKLKS